MGKTNTTELAILAQVKLETHMIIPEHLEDLRAALQLQLLLTWRLYL